LLNRIDVKDYWRNLSVGEAERDAKASGEVYVLNEVTLKFKAGSGKLKSEKKKKVYFFNVFFVRKLLVHRKEG
jgi:hypothetical protein